MKIPRRRFLRLAGGAAALPAVSCVAWAQAYPARPIRVVVGFPAGSGVDVVARVMTPLLSERLGQPVVVENRPGAASNIATEGVARSAPDGYTLLWVGPPVAINATLYEKLNFDFLRDIAPIGGVNREPNVMLVNPSFPAKTVPEFIAYAKANPGKISMASVGNGSVSHVAGELFKMMTGVEMVHVPYRGGPPAVTDLIGGRVQVLFLTTSAAMAYIKSGQIRVIGVGTETRSPALPDVPTVGESVPGFEASNFYGIGVPRDTPADIVVRLNKELNATLADPAIIARFSDLGATTMPSSPAEFGMLVAAETEKWAKVIRAGSIKPD
ncbi:MAG: tripartite tricarboxylate transporter substrate binding protein [Xanthobacteraceae bacterium]|nr:tripartite tricarboxylate transporter substrate binding protein [Xanthobacteraceae bacterium]